MTNKVIKIGTFFSGIGSPEKALERLKKENIIEDYKIQFFSEIDKNAIKSYCAIHNVDESLNLGNITDIKGADLPYCDLWVGGFPCQDISCAGKMRGFNFKSSTRSSLGWEMIRLIKEVKEEINKIFNGKKALVVDDNKLNIKVAIKVLNEFGLEVISCESGFECINKIKNNESFDIIFMDIMMPEMGGVETLKKLKQLDDFDIPVIALTADAMQGKSTKYIEVGFNEYLSKPIDKRELNKALSTIFDNKNVKSESSTEDTNSHIIKPITDDDIEELNKLLLEKENSYK